MLVLLSQIPFFPESKLQPGCLSSYLRFPFSRVQITARMLILLSHIPIFFKSPNNSQDDCPPISYSLPFRVQITARMLVLMSQSPFFPESKVQPWYLSSYLRFSFFQSPNYSQDTCPPISNCLLSRVQITARMFVLLSQISLFPESKVQPGCLSSWLCCSPLFWPLHPPQRNISWRQHRWHGHSEKNIFDKHKKNLN